MGMGKSVWRLNGRRCHLFSMKIVPGEFGGIAARRPPLRPPANREALARGWLIYLAVMLIFAGLTIILRDDPPATSLVAAPAEVAAHGVPGKFAH
jgi:hypothetical protein